MCSYFIITIIIIAIFEHDVFVHVWEWGNAINNEVDLRNMPLDDLVPAGPRPVYLDAVKLGGQKPPKSQQNFHKVQFALLFRRHLINFDPYSFSY